jgi:glutamate racemase
MNRTADAPIGVFDSGVGGLTVLRQLRAVLPNEQFVYLGDTARLPYGTKTPASVQRYSLQAAQRLLSEGVKYVVIACNTASTFALPSLTEALAPVPVIGVVEPGAEAACRATRSGRIAVLATEGTVQGGAYHRAIGRIRADAVITAQVCTVFVALAEEGWTDGEVVEAVARRYLDPVFEADPGIDTLLLGCTHFPVLSLALHAVAPAGVAVVDSAVTTAHAVHADLENRGLLAPRAGGSVRLLATDGVERFARVGARFLGEAVSPQQVDLVDITQPSG